jgi:hypothetical protein
MENAILGAAAEQRGAADPAGEAAQIAMASQRPVAVVCRVLGAPRSSLYARRAAAGAGGRPGPATSISDRDLVELIRQVLDAAPFAGEGGSQGPGPAPSRARRARQRQTGATPAPAGGCWRPSRFRGRRRPHPMTARSSLRHPTSAGAPTPPWPGPELTGWVWVFACVDHSPAEAWAPCGKVGDRFAALQPVSDAVIDRWAAWRLTSPAAWRCGMTGDPSTARPTSPAPWPGWHQRRPGVPG